MKGDMGRRAWVLVLLMAIGALAGCSSEASSSDKLRVLTTVSPITDIVGEVAGDEAEVTGVIPEGVDSHTFEPTPDTARAIASADAIFVNGLHLEDPTVELARSGMKDGATIFALGDHTIESSEYIYDFSFPRSEGRPNPHLWMDVGYAIRYAELTGEELGRIDSEHEQAYSDNAEAYVDELHRLDDAIRHSVATVPEANRVLLTYHDSFAYFAAAYGFRVIGAIQPASFSEPSAREVADLIDQIEREHIPAIFGSEVFPSPVLAQIARETGVKFEDTLRDDDLPGDPGDPEHSYAGLMAYDVATIVSSLGGDPAAVDSFAEELGT
jgi:ABC-type Zn uptake system ZnuABC Zn-binding protein ZnuA